LQARYRVNVIEPGIRVDMRVLVTGASGAIGSALCDALLARGDEVVGLSRNPARARATNPTMRWHEWRATEERPPPEALEGVNAVVNLVGEDINQRWTPETKERLVQSRERATKNLVDALVAADLRPSVLVSQSGVNYYGDRGDAILDESALPGGGFLADLCRRWEAVAMEAAKAGVRTVVLRSSPVLDSESGMLKELLLPFKLGVGGPLAGGRQYVSWIHRDDEVALILWAIEDESVEGALNAAAPRPVTNREFSKVLGRVLGRPAVIPIPKLAVAALRGRAMTEHVTMSQRALPRRALDLGFEFRFPELEPALRDLLD
jgi:uncharacterized protein